MLSKNRLVPFLMYHSISASKNAKFHPFAVPPERFAEHLAYLSEHGYTPLTVTDYRQARAGDDSLWPEQPVVLTFDDGFGDFFTAALPLLQRYKFPATLYVTTTFVGETARWLRRERESMRPMMTWEQIVQVDRSGIECGGHSHTHRQLDTLGETEVRDEVVRCKDLLQEHLGHPVMSFAYPFGCSTPMVRKQVLLAGYTSGCVMKHQMSSSRTSPLALTRFLVTPEMTGAALGQLLTGKGMLEETSLTRRMRTLLWEWCAVG